MKHFFSKQILVLILACISPLFLSAKKGFSSPLDSSIFEQEKKIWIHVFDAQDVFAIQSLTFKLKERIPYLEIFISTATSSGKFAAENSLSIDQTKVISTDDLQTLANYLNNIQPQAIIFIQHEILPSLVLLAQLNNIPLYLLNAHYSNRTERLLRTSPHLYIPLLNTFKHIFAQTSADKEIFHALGITKTHISTVGPLPAFEIFKKKDEYLKHLKTSEQQLKEDFPYPTILFKFTNKDKIPIALELFEKIKQKYPETKMILAPTFLLTGKNEIISALEKLSYSFFVWDETTDALNKKQNLIQAIKPLIDAHDILLKFVPGHLFNLKAIASFCIIDDYMTQQTIPHLVDAAAWSKPVIIGTFHQRKPDIMMHDVVIHITNPQELFEQTEKLLTDKNYVQQFKEKSLTWITHLCEKVNSDLEPLLVYLEQDIQKSLYSEQSHTIEEELYAKTSTYKQYFG
ncbi:MAG: glycosyltransferase N-terminal domain-containing protein [bacterium]